MSEEAELTPAAVIRILQAEVEQLVARQDAQERLVANLMLAYSELASGLETVIARVMQPADEAERARFRSELKEAHLLMLQVMQDAARTAAQSDPGPDTAISKLVREYEATRGEQQ